MSKTFQDINTTLNSRILDVYNSLTTNTLPNTFWQKHLYVLYSKATPQVFQNGKGPKTHAGKKSLSIRISGTWRFKMLKYSQHNIVACFRTVVQLIKAIRRRAVSWKITSILVKNVLLCYAPHYNFCVILKFLSLYNF